MSDASSNQEESSYKWSNQMGIQELFIGCESERVIKRSDIN